MKVLSLTEPYATLIKKGVKTTVCNSGCGQVIEAGVWDTQKYMPLNVIKLF